MFPDYLSVSYDYAESDDSASLRMFTYIKINQFQIINMWLRLIKVLKKNNPTSLFSSSCRKKSLSDVSTRFEQIPSIPSLVSLNTGFKIWILVGSCASVKPEPFFFLSLNFLRNYLLYSIQLYNHYKIYYTITASKLWYFFLAF